MRNRKEARKADKMFSFYIALSEYAVSGKNKVKAKMKVKVKVKEVVNLAAGIKAFTT